MDKQVFDIQSYAGIPIELSNELLRNYNLFDNSYKLIGYFNKSICKLNFEVRKGGIISPVQQQESIPMRFRKFLKKRNLEDPNELKKKKGKIPNVRTIAAIILGGSRDRMLEIAFGNQKVDLREGADNSHLQRNEDIEKWAVDMYNVICRLFGEENILSFVAHLDESNPHVHCAVVPFNEIRNKISWHTVFGQHLTESRIIWSVMHDKVSIANEKWGLKRGIDIRLTGAKHRTTKQYWAELKQECDSLEKERDALKKEIELLNKEFK